MDTGNDVETKALFKRIRLLRKKLKQIETLKLLPRKLNDEEVAKIERAERYRQELLPLLAQKAVINEREAAAAESANIEERLESQSASSIGELISADIPSEAETGRSVVRQQETSTPPKSQSKAAQKSPSNTSSISSAISSSDADIRPKAGSVKVSDAKSSKSAQTDPLRAVRSRWVHRCLEQIELVGHTDITMSVDIDEEFVVSGSRDTTVKLWSSRSGYLVQSFGGHTGQVNCVKLLTLPADADGDAPAGKMVVSGGEDCSVKFWNISTGGQVKDLYVYNSVVCFTPLTSKQYLIAGLDGGKLEVYDLRTMTSHLSHSLATDRITCLAAEGDLVAVGGSDGFVQVLEIGETVKCLYSLEEEVMGIVKSILLLSGDILVGDDWANIKRIHWKSNTVTDIANHFSEFGVTDALCSDGTHLFSTAYDYDDGVGLINVRDLTLQNYQYITTVTDSDMLHILSMAVTSPGQGQPMKIVTGGINQLVLWRDDPKQTPEYLRCEPRRLLLADDELYSDSDGSSSGEETDVSSEEEAEAQAIGSGWWCSIL